MDEMSDTAPLAQSASCLVTPDAHWALCLWKEKSALSREFHPIMIQAVSQPTANAVDADYSRRSEIRPETDLGDTFFCYTVVQLAVSET